MEKIATIKVYNPGGDFLKLWDKASFGVFTKEINGGLGECVIELNVPFDYAGQELKLGNIVEILISDKQTDEDGWILIYSGYISMYQPEINGKKEGIMVSVLGHYTKLAIDILKSGSQTTLYTDASDGIGAGSPSAAAEIGLVARAVIDRYRAENDNPKMIGSLQSMPDISRDINYVFEQKTYRDALDVLKNSCPKGYFYYVDQDGIVYLKAPDAEPKHTFMMGKHFNYVRVQRSIEKLRNVFLVWDGEPAGVYKEYKDDDSIREYGRRVETLNDYGIQDEDSADNIGEKFIAENKDPDINIVCEIMDDNYDEVNGYDIETIEPGDTCRFIGFDEASANIFRDNMVITRVDYYMHKAIIRMENVKSGLVEETKKIIKNLDQVSVLGINESYT
jgi:hypothetical protein